MVKQTKKSKPGITDWKFILMLLGILLVGLSVFVLNQKTTYKSSAYSGCADMYKNCKEDCATNSDKFGYSGVGPNNGSLKTPTQTCIQACKSEKKMCEQSGKGQANKLINTNTNTGNNFVEGNQNAACNGFNLDTCQSNCNGNSHCLSLCSTISGLCQ